MSRRPVAPDRDTRYHRLLDKIGFDQSTNTSFAFRDLPLVHSVQLLSPQLNHLVESTYTSSRITQVTTQELEHLQGLTFLREELLQIKGRYPRVKTLHFVRDKQFILQNPYTRTSFRDIVETNRGIFALIVSKHTNTEFLWLENKAFGILQALKRLGPVDAERLMLHAHLYHALRKEVTHILERLDALKETQWNSQRYDMEQRLYTGGIPTVDTSEYFMHHFDASSRETMLVHACQILGLMMYLIFGLARRPTTVLMRGYRNIVQASLKVANGPNSENRLWEDIALDPVTLVQRYHLDPVTHSYACCPKCFALYPLHNAPPLCTHRDFQDEPPCDTTLFQTRTIRSRTHETAVRLYLHQDMKEWVGRLLSRPDIDALLDEPPVPKVTKFMEDIWHGSVLKEFVGADGLKFTTKSSDGSRLKLVFSLGIDSFNSYRNLQAKQKSSSTGIYMVCLNLPPDVRYLPENIYLVGVIPGPNKPNLDQMNHSLKILVDELKVFWIPGVQYTHTGRHPNGRLVNAALIPLVCDLLAARQVAGFGSIHFRLFCSYCSLPRDDIDCFEPLLWPERTLERHREGVSAWKAAPNRTARQKVFDEYGVRWSVLMELPYWDPIQFTILESMHNWYLGLFHNHCRKVWGMSITVNDGEGYKDPSGKTPPRPDDQKMGEATAALDNHDYESLLVMDTSVLWHLCADHDLPRSKKKKALVKSLKDWIDASATEESGEAPNDNSERRRDIMAIAPGDLTAEDFSTDSITPNVPAAEQLSKEAASARRSIWKGCTVITLSRRRKPALVELCEAYHLDTSGQCKDLAERLIEALRDNPLHPPEENTDETEAQTNVIGRGVLKEIHDDMGLLQMPNWLQPAPKGFGTTAHGKLSADQWRVACTVHIPFTLIRLWGHLDENDRKRKMLDNFMQLVRAVDIAGSLRISEEDIKTYEECILNYLRGLKELYKEVTIKPNHHFAVHLAIFLRKFGPVHSWRAYVFERFNYLLQNTNTNKRPGQMEITFMNRIGRATNLRPILRDAALKDVMGDVITGYSKVINEDARGTRNRDTLSLEELSGGVGVPTSTSSPADLSDDVFEALLQCLNAERPPQEPFYIDERTRSRHNGTLFLHRKITPCKLVKVGGVSYQPGRQSLKDSNVVYYGRGDHQQICAGRIQEIFLHSRPVSEDSRVEQTFLAILRLKPLEDADKQHDYFSRYPNVGGSLYYDEYESAVDIISPAEVLCHFARTSFTLPLISRPCVHVLPLDRLLRIQRQYEIDLGLAASEEEPMDPEMDEEMDDSIDL